MMLKSGRSRYVIQVQAGVNQDISHRWQKEIAELAAGLSLKAGERADASDELIVVPYFRKVLGDWPAVAEDSCYKGHAASKFWREPLEEKAGRQPSEEEEAAEQEPSEVPAVSQTGQEPSEVLANSQAGREPLEEEEGGREPSQVPADSQAGWEPLEEEEVGREPLLGGELSEVRGEMELQVQREAQPLQAPTAEEGAAWEGASQGTP
uniref:Uncharacterized protein n=1 Tax=Chromera velia CCMP2878 TaxID=1169474 RepID=A0A0G4I864_9ALVE|eukprot:Cvel_11870.t1-p1 / transcript=Cvel_11870.t1 / gene=Cvel_11870 / organism=Chromera_velia_CCMP2878 / gene_product=hypothetical protein / transcript_product=hypothetical protein / location=Cvel_scaffold757:64715-68034(-) / protein_length=207 / sequence_SO=supercontig / SO=protein_coding / is_pseudo=false